MNWKNLLRPVYERAKSPLYGSFIVSWLIWNWRIVFVVLFSSRYNLGSLNLDQFIICNYWNPKDCFVYPLLFACIYLFLFPYVDNEIALYRAVAKKKREVKEIALNRSSREVSGEEHYQLNLKYIAERNKVLDFEADLEKEKLKTREREQGIVESNRLYRELAEKNLKDFTRLNEVQVLYNQLINRHHLPKFFHGRWTFTYTHAADSRQSRVDELKIENVTVYIVKKDGTAEEKYMLQHIDYDEAEKTLTFVKQDLRTGQYFITNLKCIKPTLLQGTEDGSNVGYEKNE